MKSKAPLALMEQIVMLLVFALAAALCLQAFVKSDQISRESQARSNAALAVQNTAETIRYSGGSFEHALMETAKRQGGKYLESTDKAEKELQISYDKEWNPAQEGEYLLTVREIPTQEEGLWKVSIQVTEKTQTAPLFELETAWLEVKENE